MTVDCSTTHLYNSGTRLHISNALSHGASFDEVMDVIKLTSTVGLDSVRLGFPLQLAEFVSDAEATSDNTGSEELEAAIRDRLGMPAETVTLDREFLEIAVEYVETAQAENGLSALEKEFVLIAANASVTHRNAEQVRVHATNAIENGAQIEEIVEVLEIASVIGSHTITETVPILVDEAAKQDKLPAGIDPP